MTDLRRYQETNTGKAWQVIDTYNDSPAHNVVYSCPHDWYPAGEVAARDGAIFEAQQLNRRWERTEEAQMKLLREENARLREERDYARTRLSELTKGINAILRASGTIVEV